MRTLLRRLAPALLVAAVALSLAGPGSATNDKPPNEGVCPGTHLSANDQTEFTYTAPDGFLVSQVCVKAGSINQGNGPETIVYDPPQKTVTFSHSSGKEISHFSVTLVPEPDEEPVEVTAGVTFVEATCEAGASVDVLEAEGVSYAVEGTVAAGQHVKVTATADEGYVLVGQSVWEHDFAVAPTDCGPPPPECPDGDHNGDEPGCGSPPECPGGDMNGDEPGCDPIAPPPERCPPGEGPYDGKDGEPGNEECCPDADGDQRCDEEGETPPPTAEPEEPEKPTTPEPRPEPPAEEKPGKPGKPGKPEAEKPRAEPAPEPEARPDPAPAEGPRASSAEEEGELPYTGLPLLPAALLGGLLSLAGIALRRGAGG